VRLGPRDALAAGSVDVHLAPGLLAPLADSSATQQHRSQNPSHPYGGNRFTVRVTATAASMRREVRPYRAI
jgi:hypothetical protein